MRDWGWIEAVVGALTLLVGAWAKSLVDLVRARSESRRTDRELDHKQLEIEQQAESSLSIAEREFREELRAENAELRGMVREVSDRLNEMGEERLKLKDALNRRDNEIAWLKKRMERLERVSQEHAECPAKIAALEQRLATFDVRLEEVSDVEHP